MVEVIACFRCGESLEKLTLPLSRRDECPSCAAHVHVCRMCLYFDRKVTRQCREDDAEEVQDKEKVNFCEWFKPNANAFDPNLAAQGVKAKSELDALFAAESATAPDEVTSPESQGAEDLFE